MSNIIAFAPKPRSGRCENLTALMQVVAQDRRPAEDVFWLKENAEILSILASVDEPVSAQGIGIYSDFYDSLEERLRFFPQYYRFFLSMCLDLEDLGMAGNKGEALCAWVHKAGLDKAELSDLQRAEACRLLARRGIVAPLAEGALGQRLQDFAERPETFALPNKKAAYELTHIVFYLSQYGAQDPCLSDAGLRSLEYTGLVAYLDQNHDLLAEICTALRFAGQTPSAIWTDAVANAHAAVRPITRQMCTSPADFYHAYLVTGWAQIIAGGDSFEILPTSTAAFFQGADVIPGALRSLSECLFDLGGARRNDWSGMRGRVVPYLDHNSRMILQQAEASSDQFEAFFSQFARAAG